MDSSYVKITGGTPCIMPFKAKGIQHDPPIAVVMVVTRASAAGARCGAARWRAHLRA
jgi:hypothetical protein